MDFCCCCCYFILILTFYQNLALKVTATSSFPHLTFGILWPKHIEKNSLLQSLRSLFQNSPFKHYEIQFRIWYQIHNWSLGTNLCNIIPYADNIKHQAQIQKCNMCSYRISTVKRHLSNNQVLLLATCESCKWLFPYDDHALFACCF